MLLDEFKNMLNKVYELEGLLELGVRRGENLPESLPSLIADKCFAIANQAAKWNTAELPAVEGVENTYSVQDNAVSAEQEDKAVEVFVNEVLPVVPSEELEKALVKESDEEILEESEELAAVESDPKRHGEELSELEAIADDTEDEASEEAEVNSDAENYAEDDDKIYEEDIEEENVVEDDIEETHPRPSTHSGRPLASFFSINDKFRFRRELFSNSNAELVDALNLIETMESLSEAEDYFFNDLQWDADSDDVIDFLKIIKTYFAPQK